MSATLIILISFFYTNIAVTISKNKDPLMITIKEYSDKLGNSLIDSYTNMDEIIPGISGVKVNINKSYENMKTIGEFDKNLLVFKEVSPTYLLNENMDKYIIAGNQNKNSVSIIFNIKDSSYIEEIIKILNCKNIAATFFLNKEIYESSQDLIKLILLSGNDIELLDNEYNKNDYNKYNSILKKIDNNEELKYCITTKKNENLLNNCKSLQMNTIYTPLLIENYLYSEIKNNLYDGMIINLKNNKNILRELSSTITYIQQKGKKIILLENLLKE